MSFQNLEQVTFPNQAYFRSKNSWKFFRLWKRNTISLKRGDGIAKTLTILSKQKQVIILFRPASNDYQLASFSEKEKQHP